MPKFVNSLVRNSLNRIMSFSHDQRPARIATQSVAGGPTTNDSPGFTLIEILIAVTILIIVSALAVPNLRRFSDTQVINTESGKLLSTIQLAQSNAHAGTVCSDKSVASSWQILLRSSGYTLRGVCTSGLNEDRTIISLPSGITISNTCPSSVLTFSKLSSDACSITITNTSSRSRTITINQGGGIQESEP